MIITVLNTVGGIIVTAGCIGLLGGAALQASASVGAGWASWGGPLGMLTCGFLLLGLAAVARQLHRVNESLSTHTHLLSETVKSTSNPEIGGAAVMTRRS